LFPHVWFHHFLLHPLSLSLSQSPCVFSSLFMLPCFCSSVSVYLCLVFSRSVLCFCLRAFASVVISA
jgi:hypothetical protein